MATTIGLGLSNPQHGEILKKTLVSNGFHVVFAVFEGNDVLRRARGLKPDIVILDFNLPGYPGYDIANILYEDGISLPLLLLNENQKSIVSRGKMSYEHVCLTKPFKIDILLNTIEVLSKSHVKISALKSEIKSLKESIESRKVIEKAKAILMMKFNLSEEEAHKNIQKQSMDKRITRKEIAEALIRLHEE